MSKGVAGSSPSCRSVVMFDGNAYSLDQSLNNRSSQYIFIIIFFNRVLTDRIQNGMDSTPQLRREMAKGHMGWNLLTL